MLEHEADASRADRLASDVAIGKLFEAMKKETPPPDEAALKKIYDDNKDKFVVPDTASAMHILVKVDKDANYGTMQEVMQILQEENATRFNIITELKVKRS